jgi:hypothetical protein
MTENRPAERRDTLRRAGFRCLWANMWSRGGKPKSRDKKCSIKATVSRIIGNYQARESDG